jgi:hypothetical protein
MDGPGPVGGLPKLLRAYVRQPVVRYSQQSSKPPMAAFVFFVI